MSIKWKIIAYLAKTFDMFYVENFDGAKIEKLPLARVEFEKGFYSCWMAIGNALKLANLYNAKIQTYNKENPSPLLNPKGLWTWF